jgi:predicted dehydrogenase
MAYTVNFERATADYDLARGAEALKIHEDGKPVQGVKIPDGDGYDGELRHFLDGISSGKGPTVVSAQEGASAVEICEAEEQSVLSGEAVRL